MGRTSSLLFLGGGVSEAFPPGIEVVLESQVWWVAYINGSFLVFLAMCFSFSALPKWGSPQSLKPWGIGGQVKARLGLSRTFLCTPLSPVKNQPTFFLFESY